MFITKWPIITKSEKLKVGLYVGNYVRSMVKRVLLGWLTIAISNSSKHCNSLYKLLQVVLMSELRTTNCLSVTALKISAGSLKI